MGSITSGSVLSKPNFLKGLVTIPLRCAYQASHALNKLDDEFRVLTLYGNKVKARQEQKKRVIKPPPPPRETRMLVDQNWANVWPGPKTFHPASVPLPVRQGLNNLGPSPTKYANAELMKIPNFLHLTPPAIKEHCAVIKKFCTKWPVELETDEDCKKHFPVEVTTTDYCHSSPSIRDPLSRIVTVMIPLDRLPLDNHSRDKFLRLACDCYDENTGVVTIVSNKCPLRGQNLDYAMYLFTALLHESWVFEPWETEKIEEDCEFFDWEKSASKANVEYLLKFTGELHSEAVNNYILHVLSLFDQGETDSNLREYSHSCEQLLFP